MNRLQAINALSISPSSAYSTVYAIFKWLTYLNFTYISKYPHNFNLLCNLYRCHLLLLTLLASVRLFTSDTKHLVPPKHASGSHMFPFRPSKVIAIKLHCIGVILYKQMCTQMGLLPYLGYKLTYEPTFHIRDLWQFVY